MCTLARVTFLDSLNEKELSVVCLRPGTIIGPGTEVNTPMMGFKFADNVFAVIGRGDFIIPLVYIDKLVDAILISLENNDSIGKVYNVVDSDRVTER